MLLLTAFCAFAKGNAEKELGVLNVSYVKSPFNLPSIVMKERNMLETAFAQEGIEVRYYEIESGAKQSQAMAAGSLDVGGVMNTTSVLLACSAGNDVRIISPYSCPVKVFSIVSAREDIQSPVDLAGRSVAGPKGTVLHQLLLASLDREGLEIEDTEFLQMDLPQAATAMIAGHIDAALLAGSLAINSVRQGAHIVCSAEGYVRPTLVIAARGSFIDEYPEAIALYLAVHQEAVQWMQNNLDEALELGAESQGISLDEARQLYEWTQFRDELDETDLKALRDDVDFMLKTDLLRKRIDPVSCIAENIRP